MQIFANAGHSPQNLTSPQSIHSRHYHIDKSCQKRHSKSESAGTPPSQVHVNFTFSFFCVCMPAYYPPPALHGDQQEKVKSLEHLTTI